MRIVNGKATTKDQLSKSLHGILRYYVGPIEGPPETPRTSEHYGIEEFKGGTSIDPQLFQKRLMLMSYDIFCLFSQTSIVYI